MVDVIFNNNTAKNSAGTRVFTPGLENRRINDLTSAIGLPVPETLSGTKLITINFNGNFTAAQDVAESIIQQYDSISARIAKLGSAANSLQALRANLLQGAETVLIANGIYIAQSGDTVAGIVSNYSQALSAFSGQQIGQIIADINNLSSTSSSVLSGTVLLVPTAITTVQGTPIQIPSSSSNAYFFDISNEVFVTTSAYPNKANTGTLTIINNSGQVIGTVVAGYALSIVQSSAQTYVIALPGNHTLTVNSNGSGYLDNQQALQFVSGGHFIVKVTGDPAVEIELDNPSGSQVIEYKTTSSVETITQYASSDGTGGQVSQEINEANGTSQIINISNDSITDYSGPYGTGSVIGTDYLGIQASYQWQGGSGNIGDASLWLDENLHPPASDEAPGTESSVEFPTDAAVSGTGNFYQVTIRLWRFAYRPRNASSAVV